MTEYIWLLVCAQFWQISLVVVCVGLVTRLVRRRFAHLAHVLWVLVLIKCLTPPLWGSPTSIFAWAPRQSPTCFQQDDLVPPGFVATFEPESSSQKPSELFTPQLGLGNQRGPRRIAIVGVWTWLAGTALFGLLGVGRWWSFARQLHKTSDPLSDSVEVMIDQLRRRLGIRRRCRARVVDSGYGPAVIGFFRPVLVLPQSFVTTARNPKELEPVLAHELVHARRGDTALGLLQFFSQIIWWFHPLVWWANRQANRMCEQCCDEEVVASMNYSPRFYADTLLWVVEQRHRHHPMFVFSGVRSAGITAERLGFLMHHRHRFCPRTPKLCWAAMLASALLLLPGASLVRGWESPQEDQTKTAADQAFASQSWLEAAEGYRKLTVENPKDARSWFRLGYSLHAAGRLEEATEAHRKAAEFPAVRPVALYNWSCALALQKKPEAALTKLKEAIDAGFKSRQPLGLDKDFASLRDTAEFKELAELAKPLGQQKVYRQFDFWIGKWNVFNPAGVQVGTNVITKDEQGFLIVEKWTSANGGTGTSINFYDPGDKKWKQTWVDAGGNVVRYSGNFTAGKMQLTGQTVQANGQRALSRVSFTPLANGKVRQLIERSTDAGKTWSVYFDGTYVRQPQTGNAKPLNKAETTQQNGGGLKLIRAINKSCPRSGEPIAADALTTYRGFTVGFCNQKCRDDFAAHLAQRPRDRGFFDTLIAKRTVVN